MWIKSKYGLFNVECIEKFFEPHQQTFAFLTGKSTPIKISDSPVLDKITDAIRRGESFMEVE